MTQSHYFGTAKWVEAENVSEKGFYILRGRFNVHRAEKVLLNVLGLGFFQCYINGTCINPDTFLPLSSDYAAVGEPKDEKMSAHRIYVPHFEITPFVREGENVLALHFGGGWYTYFERVFGTPKAIYRVTVSGADGTREYGSDEHCRMAKGYVEDYCLTTHEVQGKKASASVFAPEFDDSLWANACAAAPLDTAYCESDCPADALIRTLTPQKIGCGTEGTVYDCGENLTGYPVLRLQGEAGACVTVRFSEELAEDGTLDEKHMHKQYFSAVSDGCGCVVQPEFTWFAFRYFEVVGEAEVSTVKVVHADVPTASDFSCDNDTLNWIYQTFLHTMHCNMHTGHPSDCPHLERRGYTGDGQLTLHAALSSFDARAFYEKWLRDIADSQDVFSGHIQNAAPYIRSGGGPGGWGSAIVEVPYQIYRHYGEREILETYYPHMRRYIDYLESHTEFGLVTSDKKGEWCLGDWCGPIVLYPDREITSTHNQQMIIPAAMVNTYFAAKSLRRMAEIAEILGESEEAGKWTVKAQGREKAISAAYFNAFDHNFLMNVQGANAYGIDLGLGDERTYRNLVSYYEKLGHYDTGIFATDILTRVLFEHGNADLAVALLTQNGAQGYERWRRNGATTFHEYWDSRRSRSHNHPMFGAPVACFFDYLLGIRQAPDSVGYRSLVIAPCALEKFAFLKGSMQTVRGHIEVFYEKQEEKWLCRILIPSDTEAVFRFGGKEYPLHTGENLLTVS